jgi:hypothetical protein
MIIAATNGRIFTSCFILSMVKCTSFSVSYDSKKNADYGNVSKQYRGAGRIKNYGVLQSALHGYFPLLS